MPDIPRLDYAPPPPMHRRRSFRRWVYATVLLGVAISGWWWAPPAWRRVELLYWQHECMVYVPLAGQVVYDSNSSKDIVPKEWREFYRRLSPPGFMSYGTPFMQEMRKPNGDYRLVVVDTIQSRFMAGQVIAWPRVFSEAGLFQEVTEFPGKVNSECELAQLYSLLAPQWKETLKVFAGHIDPLDPTHFTFRTARDEKMSFMTAGSKTTTPSFLASDNPPPSK